MSPVHLVWIIPMSVVIGFIYGALMGANKW